MAMASPRAGVILALGRRRAPGAGGWRRFSSLSLQQRIEVLRSWYSSRLFVRRLIFKRRN